MLLLLYVMLFYYYYYYYSYLFQFLRSGTDVVLKLADHAVPQPGVSDWVAVLAVPDGLERVVEAQDLGYAFDQVDAEAFEPVVSYEPLRVLLQLHVRQRVLIINCKKKKRSQKQRFIFLCLLLT